MQPIFYVHVHQMEFTLKDKVVYVVARRGSGKTELIKHLIRQQREVFNQ